MRPVRALQILALGTWGLAVPWLACIPAIPPDIAILGDADTRPDDANPSSDGAEATLRDGRATGDADSSREDDARADRSDVEERADADARADVDVLLDATQPHDARADSDAADVLVSSDPPKVLLRASPPSVLANGTILAVTIADGGAAADLSALVLNANDPPAATSRYGLRRPTMSPHGKWMAISTDRWSSASVEYTYLFPVPGYQKQILRIAGGPGLSSSFDVEEPAVVNDTGTLVVFEAKSGAPLDGGAREGRWLYMATRTGTAWGPATLVTRPDQPYNGHAVGVLSADGMRVLSSCSVDRDADEDHVEAICETTLATGQTVPIVRANALDDAGIAAVSNPTYAPDGSVVFVADNWPPVDNRQRIWRLTGGQLRMVSTAGDKDFHACALADGRVAAITSVNGEHKLRVLGSGGATNALLDFPGAGLRITPPRSIYCFQ